MKTNDERKDEENEENKREPREDRENDINRYLYISIDDQSLS